MIYDRYSNKDKHDATDAIVITQRYFIRVATREQLCIFMKYENFGDHELHYVHKCVISIIEGSEAHAFEDSEEKQERGEVAVKSDACETPIHANNQEGINALIEDGYKVDDDRIPDPDNIPINIGRTD